MTNEEHLKSVSKCDIMFRFMSECFNCPYLEGSGMLSWECTNDEEEAQCRAEFESWMRKEVE